MSRILIVEDELIISASYSAVLEKDGHEIVGCATTAEEAIEQYEENEVDIVLMDLQLKDASSGVDAAKFIRDAGSTPIIFTTGNSRASVHEMVKGIDISSVLGKPVEPQILLATIKELLNHAARSTTG